jgi:hypothetical protein
MKVCLNALMLCCVLSFIILTSCSVKASPELPLKLMLNGEQVTSDNIDGMFFPTPRIPGIYLSELGRSIIFTGVVTDVADKQVIIEVSGNTLSISGETLAVSGQTGVAIVSGKQSPAIGRLSLTKDLIGKPITVWVSISEEGVIVADLKV